MKNHGTCRRVNVALVILLMAGCAMAQDALRGTLTMGFGDIASIKQKAEAGDAEAQVALGNSLASRFHSVEALGWFRRAAEQGNVDGAYQAGHLLLNGGPGIPKEQTVEPNPAEGIHWAFCAATNFHALACRDLAHAYQKGTGVSTNWIEAYAWLQLCADTGSIVGKVELNELALKMDTATIQQAQALAARYKQRDWDRPATQVIPSGDEALKLRGITFGRVPMAVISGKTLAEGESAKITLKGQNSVTVKCLKIEKDSVTVAVEGETTSRRLTMK